MRLSKDALRFVKESKLSYSEISSEVKRLFNLQVSKSGISYHKKSRKREFELDFSNINDEERDWLNGLFLADGCKFMEKSYSYTIKIALDKKNDNAVLTKLIDILGKLGCNFKIYSQGNSAIVKMCSKQLFDRLPVKNVLFVPKDNYAFLAGLIDGDGCRKGNSAILVQYKNIETMNQISRALSLKPSISTVITNFGRSERRQYYIPKDICDILKQKFLSMKLCINVRARSSAW